MHRSFWQRGNLTSFEMIINKVYRSGSAPVRELEGGRINVVIEEYCPACLEVNDEASFSGLIAAHLHTWGRQGSKTYFVISNNVFARDMCQLPNRYGRRVDRLKNYICQHCYNDQWLSTQLRC